MDIGLHSCNSEFCADTFFRRTNINNSYGEGDGQNSFLW